MKFRLVVAVTSILASALAVGTAEANDRNASILQTAPSNPATIFQGSGRASGPPTEYSLHSTVYEGAKWNTRAAITWSLARRSGNADSPFSGYMGPQFEALIQQAFDTWAGASGLTFQEVADSTESDIRLGWGEFNTPVTGVVGHTICQAHSGEFLPGAIIRLEDPSQDSLVAAAGNTLTYAGTDANLYQVILHEIGHALGLADNNDPKSVMYYEATGANNRLARNDVAGIQALYGSPELSTRAFHIAASELAAARVKPLALP